MIRQKKQYRIASEEQKQISESNLRQCRQHVKKQTCVMKTERHILQVSQTANRFQKNPQYQKKLSASVKTGK